jgi:hypothetical protein
MILVVQASLVSGVHAGLGRNVSAEKHMQQVLTKALSFDLTRLTNTRSTPPTAHAHSAAPTSEAANATNGVALSVACATATAAPEEEVVFVLDAAKRVVVHKLTNPAHAFCACTCETAVQRKTCVHQVAWLLSEFPFGDPTHRVILRLLGTRFGFDGGCSMESIKAVTSALQTLAAERWAHPTTSAPANHTSQRQGDPSLAAEAGTGNAIGCGSSGRNSGGSAELEAPVVPGPRAIDNHVQRMRQALERQIACLRSADPNLHANMMTQQESGLLHLEDAMVRAAGATFSRRSNFQMSGDGCFARKKGVLERSMAKKRKQPVPSPPQPQNFAQSRRDDSQHMSKALANGRGVQQAIEHVAAALDTSCKENTAIRPALSHNSSGCLVARNLTARNCNAPAASAQNTTLFKPAQELFGHRRMQQQQAARLQGATHAGTGGRDCAQSPFQCLSDHGNLPK